MCGRVGRVVMVVEVLLLLLLRRVRKGGRLKVCEANRRGRLRRRYRQRRWRGLGRKRRVSCCCWLLAHLLHVGSGYDGLLHAELLLKLLQDLDGRLLRGGSGGGVPEREGN